MQKLSASIGAILITILPAVTLAQEAEFDDLENYASGITDFINETLIPLVFAVALLVFIFGMYRFFIQGGHDDDSRAKGKQLMIWSIAGFVLMVSIFGIVNLISGGLGFSGDPLENIPQGPTGPTGGGGGGGGGARAI